MALSRIFFSANENETVKQNNQSYCRKMKDTDKTLVVIVFRLINYAISNMDVIKWLPILV